MKLCKAKDLFDQCQKKKRKMDDSKEMKDQSCEEVLIKEKKKSKKVAAKQRWGSWSVCTRNETTIGELGELAGEVGRQVVSESTGPGRNQ